MVAAYAWSSLRITRRNLDTAGRKEAEMGGLQLRLEGPHHGLSPS